MIIIYGRRSYGWIDCHRGERAQTRFAHVWFMPLIPDGSYWVSDDRRGVVGFPIDHCGKSVLAAYLRCWGPVVAAIGAATVTVPGIAAAIAALAGCIWSWTRRSLRGPLAERRSDFQLLAYGTRCDPRRFPRDMRARMKAELDERWSALATGRPPDDVAKFGARSIDEAVVAYGILRLTAINGHADADTAADRILHETRDMPADDAGPYRRYDPGANDVVAQVAAAANAPRPASPQPVPTRSAPAAPAVPWWAYTRLKALILCLIGVAAIGGLVAESSALCGTRQVAGADVAGISERELVEIRCETLDNVGTFERPAYVCMLDGRALAVLGTPDDGNVVVGKLRSIADDTTHRWPPEVTTSGQFYGQYLDIESKLTALAIAVGSILVLVLVAGAGVFWLRAWRRCARATIRT